MSLLAAIAAALVAVLALGGCSLLGQAAAAPAGEPVFGTLVTEPDHVEDEVRAGVTGTMVELSWAQAEPAPGRFDEDYLGSVRTEVDTLRAAGRPVSLGLGLHATPDWVLALPDARFVNQDGAVSAEANLVFAQDARVAAEGYLSEVARQLDLAGVAAVRLTSGGSPEVLYPGGGYWAFDRHAQTGAGLPPSMPPNPLPGWRPGTPGPDPGRVRAWADWYVGALADVVGWQLDTLGRLGFRGSYEVVTPGVGVQPGDYDRAVREGLPSGLLGSGAAWQVLYAALPRRSDLLAYVSSVADGSGGDDGCRADDVAALDGAPDGTTTAWSATRWIAAVARRNGFGVAGENPGWHQSDALDALYVDTSGTGMMAAAVRQARSCGLVAFYWAHDAQLWDGTVPFRRYAELVGAR
ncbi:MAG: beta-galactosidase [Pseudonocardia sp.]|uniref:beta-galactosidase n=1 Tax=Pseudonocardia sp. TaxID=60912 RepID=UPI001ACF6804|nr:beta-galactosidase [Pseudonocardia sp.]MBN9102586.1 beta-galactosidase [Pseudonocardia sp.]